MFFGRDPFGVLGKLAQGLHQSGVGLDLGAVRFVEPGEVDFPFAADDGQVIRPQGLF